MDDHPAIREALALVIGRNYPDLEVCGEADSAPAGARRIGRCNPDLAVIDVTLKQGNGLELTERLQALHPHVRVLIYSMHEPELYAARARRAGARGYLSKEHGVSEVLAALRMVRDGERVFPETPTDDDVLRNGESHNGAPADAADLLVEPRVGSARTLGRGIRHEHDRRPHAAQRKNGGNLSGPAQEKARHHAPRGADPLRRRVVAGTASGGRRRARRRRPTVTLLRPYRAVGSC